MFIVVTCPKPIAAIVCYCHIVLCQRVPPSGSPTFLICSLTVVVVAKQYVVISSVINLTIVIDIKATVFDVSVTTTTKTIILLNTVFACYSCHV